MYRRDVVERTGGFREDLPIIQDQRFLFDAAHHNACFGYSKHVGAEYRVLPGSVSHRNPIVVWHDILENARQIETLWRTQGQLSAVQEDELARVYNYLARNFFSAGDDAYFRAVKYLQGTTDRLPLHARIAEPLASAFGLRMAQRALRFPSALMEFSRRCLSRGHIEATIE